MLAVAIVGSLPHAQAELRPAEQQKVDALNKSLHHIAVLYRGKKYVELGKAIEELQQAYDELKNAEDLELQAALGGMDLRVEAAQRLLKSTLDQAAAKPVAKKPVMPVKPKPKMVAGGISYANQIAPLLASKCGRCHIDKQSGGFSVASYASLRQGSENGTVFNPGKGKGSTLVDLLESGDMPRGGGKLNDEEIDMIIKWIDSGAPFDGGDPTAMVAMAGPGGPSMSDAPTGNEKVSFMRDIAPILVDNCVTCHSGTQGSDNFELDTFARLKQGGRNNTDVLSAGRPGSSILVKMIKGVQKDNTGKVRPRMPRNGSALSSDEIAKFETWIAEGAKFDGDDPNEEIEFLVRVNQAAKMSHEELAQYREGLAKRNWSKGNPGVPFDKVERDDFVLYGNMTPARLTECADMIDTERSKLTGLLRLTPGKPLLKGKVSIFVFDKRFELTEFARMVDKRELTNDTNAFFVFNVVDAFGAVLAPKENDTSFPLLVSEILCGCYVDSQGRNVPAWFSDGAGRYYAAKAEPRSALVKHWDDSVGPALAGARPGFVNDKSVDGQNAALAYGLVKTMMANGSAFNALLEMLRKGTRFDTAVQRAYGASPLQLAERFTGTRAGRPGR
jgi:mono/diheme cytochrome c family protein